MVSRDGSSESIPALSAGELRPGATAREASSTVDARRHFWPAAGFWVRLLALAIDAAWLGGLIWGLIYLELRAGWPAPLWPVITAMVLPTLLLTWLWFRWQTSPGKSILGLRVLRLDGAQLGWRSASLRALGYLVNVLTCGLGFALIGLNASKRGIHDLLAATYVGRPPSVGSFRGRVAWKPLAPAELPTTLLPSTDLGLDSGPHQETSRGGTAARERKSMSKSEASEWDRHSTLPPFPLRILGVLGAVVLGAVLLFGAWAKALDPVAFAEQIHQQGLDVVLSARVVATFAILLEVGLGMALVLNVRRLWVLWPAALLVVFFLFLTGRTYYLFSHGLLEADVGCGCFGNLVERTPAEAFWQDLALLVPSLLAAFVGRQRVAGPPKLRLGAVALAMLGMGLFAWWSPALPIDDLATRLSVGKRLDQICSGSGSQRICLGTLWVPFESDEHLVVIADLEEGAIGDLVGRLNAYTDQGHSVVLLSSGTPEQNRMFFWQWGPVFEIVETPVALVRSLYRTLPRSFLVVDGVVTQTWSGLPPFLPPPQKLDDLFAIDEPMASPDETPDGASRDGNQ